MQRAVIFAAGDVVEVDALHLSLSSALSVAAAPAVSVGNSPINAVESSAVDCETIKDKERRHILETLAAVSGSRKLAGERLGMSERTLRHKLKQYREAGLFKE